MAESNPQLRCDTCPYWISLGVSRPGECHHALVLQAEHGVNRYADWWCSEHPLAPGQRDRIAEIAMQGIVTDANAVSHVDPYADTIVGRAYQIADAMMKWRRK